MNRWKYGFIFGTGSVLLFYNYWTLVLLGILASSAAGSEYVKLVVKEGTGRTERYLLTAMMPIFILLSGFAIRMNRMDLLFLFYAIMIPVLGGLGVLLYQDFPRIKGHMTESIFGILYISLALSACLYIYQHFGWIYALFSVTSPWLFDSFAFFVGIRFGKHKLMPKISPKKTVEGFIGGLVFTFLGLFILTHFMNWLSPIVSFFGEKGGIELTLFELFLLTLFISWGSTLGDLFESALKRAHAKKDAGDIMPGHGGLLDRIDSLVFVAPLFLFVLKIFH